MTDDPGLAEELGTHWEAPEHSYLWTPVLNLFWRHKKIGHQEEHILSLESKGQSWSLLLSPKGRGQSWQLNLWGKGSWLHQVINSAPGKHLQGGQLK